MAISDADKLKYYNDALVHLGQNSLASLTDDIEPRYLLDNAWDLGAVKYCLEVAKPVFSRKTALLNSPATSSVHDLDQVHTLPTDYIVMVAPYSDNKLDDKLSRYIIEGNTLACDIDPVYLRYISDDYETTNTYWSQSFVRVLTSYLARELTIKIAPNRYEELSNLLTSRVEILQDLDAANEPERRSSQSTVTLTNEWRKVYNDALLIMGLDEISSNTDDSNRKTKLDRAKDAGIVEQLLELTGWQFALTTKKLQYDPSLEPDWGYSRVFAKPTDLQRLDGLFTDEYMRVPLKAYHEEGDNYYCDWDEFYLGYMSTDFVVNPAQWPDFFRALVASRMAHDAAPSLKNEGSDLANAIRVYDDRESRARSNDAMQSPPRTIYPGRWRSRRYTRRRTSYNDRP